MRKMDIKTIYQDDEVTLQRLIITVGDCKMTKYRQVTKDGDLGLYVKEFKEAPSWYLRSLKLKKLGI